jgi:hypothetical protein
VLHVACSVADQSVVPKCYPKQVFESQTPPVHLVYSYMKRLDRHETFKTDSFRTHMSSISYNPRFHGIKHSITTSNQTPHSRWHSHLSPQPFQLLQHNQVCIQKPIHALPHTRLLVLVQLTFLDRAARDAFSETCIGKAVDCCQAYISKRLYMYRR